MTLSRVDLPEPDGPDIATCSLSATSQAGMSSTTKGSAPERYSKMRLFMVMSIQALHRS